MTQRFIFRQVDYRDLRTFLVDGMIKAKNCTQSQACHQTSYTEIVSRRGTDVFTMPCGGVVNDYVPFYFSPKTSFAYTISLGNVTVLAPDGTSLGKSNQDDRIFFVARPETIRDANLEYCFSNIALNAHAPVPALEQDLEKLETHVHWRVFDETPRGALIEEIGYNGVCRWFKDSGNPKWRMNRSKERMAEFLVRDFVPLCVFDCIVVRSTDMKHRMENIMADSIWNIPIYNKPECYF